jgi:hypothetical protein
MEEDMKLLTSDELTRCSKPELCDLFRQTSSALTELAEGTFDHGIAMLNLVKLRRALARFDVVL